MTTQSVEQTEEGDSPETTQHQSLWRNRNFNAYFWGRAVSSVGDGFVHITVPLLVYAATGSALKMGTVSILGFVVGMVADLALAGVVDRMERKRVLIATDIGRFVAYSIFVAYWLIFGPSMLALYSLVVVSGTMTSMFRLAGQGLIVRVVPKERLVDAISRLSVMQSASTIIGPMLGGILSGWKGPTVALAINAASFLLSAFALLLVRVPGEALQEPAETNESTWQFLSAGVRAILQHAVLRAVTITMAFVAAWLACVEDLFTFHLKKTLAASDESVGVFFAVASVGAVLGGLSAPMFRKRFGFGASFIGGLVLEGFTILALAYTASYSTTLGVVLAFFMAQNVRFVVMLVLPQETLPERLQGRVYAAYANVMSLGVPLGTACMTLLAETYGSRVALQALGAVVFLSAILASRTAARTAEPEVVEDKPL